MSDQQWSYHAWVVKTPGVNGLTETMNAFGLEGWEMVTSVTTVKTWLNVSGNDLVFVFKKPGAGQGHLVEPCDHADRTRPGHRVLAGVS
jgi:hypothetical protein